MFKILDWCGNDLTDYYGTFKTFDDAWSKLMETFPNDEDLEEYQVLEL